MTTIIEHERAYGFVSDAIRTVPRPHQGFIVDIVDYGYKPGEDTDVKSHTFALRIYRENMAEYSTPQQTDLAQWISERLESIKTFAPPNVRVGIEVEDIVPGKDTK